MNSHWMQTALFAVGACIALASGLWMMRTARVQHQIPQEVVGAQKLLEKIGREQGLARRQHSLSVNLRYLEKEREAKEGDAATFSQRLEELFTELDLRITGASPWQAVPGVEIAGAAAFERTFEGNGALQSLVDAIFSIESWPDQVRVRALTVTAETSGRVSFTVEISTVRRLPSQVL